jgi:hypothetical protein
MLSLLCLLCPFILAGERVPFDGNLRPQFTAHQMQTVSAATRAGLAKWAATEHGRKLIKRFSTDEYEITVVEDVHESSPGRAPQPGIATLIAADNRRKLKAYRIFLNPTFFQVSRDQAPFPDEPATPADVMAAAFGAEMLHIDFYSRGISLPHHERPDFQREWRVIAEELGMPGLRHEEYDELDSDRRRNAPLVQFLGRE